MLFVTETQYICEGYQGTISCAHKPGTVINIAYANYGRRTGADTCPDSDMYNQYCYAVNSTLIVKSQCESKVSCNIWANNTVFGDPCADTYKYLEVRIHCKAAGIVVRKGIVVGGNLTLCILGNFPCFCCRLLIFSKLTLFKAFQLLLF